MEKKNQKQTPLLDAMDRFQKQRPAYFRIPGHRFERGVSQRLTEKTGEKVFSFDLTEAEGLDDLHHPEGVIAESQRLASEVFGADETFFLVNGTTCGNEAMVLSAVLEGEKILIPRNAHKSVLMGLILSGATPVYITPPYDSEWNIWGGITPESVKLALEKDPDIRAVFVVSPTYYGICSDLQEIAEVCHSRDVLLLVDEAHGAHLYFSDLLPRGAMQQGADACAQSLHKVTASLTQSSMLQLCTKRMKKSTVASNLQLVQSTSPSYLLMASLDASRYELALHGKEMMEKAYMLAEKARKAMKQIKGIACLGKEEKGCYGISDLDPTRLVFSAAELNISGYELQELLYERYQVTLELCDDRNVVAVVTFANEEEDIERLLSGLREISAQGKRNKKLPVADVLPPVPPMKRTPRNAYFGEKQNIPWESAIGKIAGEMLVPYPPGIPILYPGEIVTKEVWDYMEKYRKAKHGLHGPADESLQKFQILSEK